MTTDPSPEHPTARTFLVRANNPSPMTLDGTNTWVLVAPGQTRAIVVDPGPDDASHRHAVMAAVEDAGANQVALILLTHGHADHAAGAPGTPPTDRRPDARNGTGALLGRVSSSWPIASSCK